MNESDGKLFPTDDVQRYESEWRTIQAGFVDDPEVAVRDADKLIEHVMGTVASKLKERRTDLTAGGTGDGERTEQLRVALRRYRTLFQQLTGLSSSENGLPRPATDTTARHASPLPDRSSPTPSGAPGAGSAEAAGAGRGEVVEHRADPPNGE